MQTITDIDIDFADRDLALEELLHIPASRVQDGQLRKHNVGVYFQTIPVDPLTGLASIEYQEAEARGYFKIDCLNLNIYKKVRDEEHLMQLIEQEPMWQLLEDEAIVNQLFQINSHFEVVNAMKPTSIEQLAMVIALIRPGKRHLIGKSWDEIEKDIWVVPTDDTYYFKKAHAISYAMVLVVQMNLMLEDVMAQLEEATQCPDSPSNSSDFLHTA